MVDAGIFRGFLSRLRRDARGNTLALVAAAMMPLVGLIGGGVDMSRLYLTKSRLQQACDAGALAGRKAMGAGSWTTGSTGSEGKANLLFGGNFQQGDYGTGTLTKSFAESNGTVSGSASVAVPMTLMRVFGIQSRPLAVSCSAKMELPNTDVMFVLDVTGSMNCVAGDTSCTNNGNVAATGSKIIGLKKAVKCFYEALVKVNTTEVCGNDPTATTATTTAQIRIGFMPYSVNVNVGKLLPNAYFADSWTYQSRVPIPYSGAATSWEIYGSVISQSDCLKYMNNQSFSGFSPSATTLGGAPYDRVAVTFPSDGVATAGGSSGEWGWTGASDTSGTTRSCRRLRTETVNQTNSYRLFKTWSYQPQSFNVSGLKAGGSLWNNSISVPVGNGGANATITWDGCVEERQTWQNTDGDPSDDWSPVPATALDMDISTPPTLSVETQWGPLLQGAIWNRYSGSNTTSVFQSTADLSHNTSYYCTTQASKLAIYNTAPALESYVNSLNAIGNTYHDIGMLWGARFLSPTGIFASENAATPTGGIIQRHLIFMTDGDTQSNDTDQTAYGAAFWDRRQTSYDPTSAQLQNNINARLTALCEAVKNMNITLWVISYGGGINTATETRLQNCATTGHYYAAANNAALLSRFQSIASEISELRLTN